MPSAGEGLHWLVSDQIDGTSTGTYTVGTTQSLGSAPYLKFYPLGVAVVLENYSNVITAALISVGTNSTSYDNLASIQSIGSAIGVVNELMKASPSPLISAATDIKVKVTTAATGLGSEVCDFRVIVYGFYF
jgi:hypothetical protein